MDPVKLQGESMPEKLRRALGYGAAPWLNDRRVQVGLGLLTVWAVGTLANSLWSAATIPQPGQDQIDALLAGILMPGIVLPALVLAALGSRLAWAAMVTFEVLDILNNLDGLDALAVHLVVAAAVIQAAVVVWRFRRQPPAASGLSIDRAPEGEVPTGVVTDAKVARWKRINLATVVTGSLIAFTAFAGTAGYAAHHGSLSLITPAVAMFVAAIGWTTAVVLAVWLWKRLPLLLWLAVPGVYILGFVFMSAACPGCTWASH